MRVGHPSKLRAAQRLAAALGAIALLRGDQAEVHSLGDGRSRPLVRLDGPRQVSALAQELERVPESVGTGLEAALADYARGGALSDVAMLISDAQVPSDELARALDTLASCGRTAGLLHVVAGDEIETAWRGPVELRDAESGRIVETTLDEGAAADYAERFEQFAEGVREQCRAAGVRYLRAPQRRGAARLAPRQRHRGVADRGLRAGRPRTHQQPRADRDQVEQQREHEQRHAQRALVARHGTEIVRRQQLAAGLRRELPERGPAEIARPPLGRVGHVDEHALRPPSAAGSASVSP